MHLIIFLSHCPIVFTSKNTQILQSAEETVASITPLLNHQQTAVQNSQNLVYDLPV